MPRRVIDLQDKPLLDVVSYACGWRSLTPQQRQQIAPTIRGVPEVMVKVSGGERTLSRVQRHAKYISPQGGLELETDMGTPIGSPGFERNLVEDWNLDLEALCHSARSIRGRKLAKLVHNLIFSMPAGVSSEKVLSAVRKFAVDEWRLQHRYAMVLHADTPHPHVHVVVKAMSEQGVRLNIKKATLRAWRAQFAPNLRELGVAPNVTERGARRNQVPQIRRLLSGKCARDSRLGLLRCKQKLSGKFARAGLDRNPATKKQLPKIAGATIDALRAPHELKLLFQTPEHRLLSQRA